jgi:hypothetical protein
VASLDLWPNWLFSPRLYPAVPRICAIAKTEEREEQGACPLNSAGRRGRGRCGEGQWSLRVQGACGCGLLAVRFAALLRTTTLAFDRPIGVHSLSFLTLRHFSRTHLHLLCTPQTIFQHRICRHLDYLTQHRHRNQRLLSFNHQRNVCDSIFGN